MHWGAIRIPIRVKLAVALATPLLVLSAVTALEVARSAREADTVRRQSDLARAAVGHRGLITALENERSWASSEVGGVADSFEMPVRGYTETREQTDAALAAFRAGLTGREQLVQNAFRPAVDALSELDRLRADIDGYNGPRSIGEPFPTEVYDRYVALLQPLLNANSLVVSAIDDPRLREGASLVDLATRQAQVQADLTRMVVIGVLVRGGITTPPQVVEIARARASFQRNNTEILAIAEPYRSVVDERYPRELADLTTEAVESALTTGTTDVNGLLAGIETGHEAGYYGMRDQAVEVLLAQADDLVGDAEALQRRFMVLAVVTTLAALVVTWLVSRSITQPLRSLTRQATAMANHRLPEAVTEVLATPLGDDVAVPHVDPMKVRTHDEVSDVADALNTVQDTALSLAVEQAVLRRNIADSFMNLGRRNQNLLGRQLDFISSLESNESDPDVLANLFRLDHLATRMRRNAESLLVLAGEEPPRQWGAPVSLTAVVRAALSEVESFQRVTVRRLEPASVLGAAAADLAHLLAELVENALVFSPPERIVEIRGWLVHPAYTLAIIDSGLGMSPEDLEAANRRLAGAESFTIAPSKYLGHYVAGNLAARHGIAVRLGRTSGSGITATVDLPPGLVTPGPLDTGTTSELGGQGQWAPRLDRRVQGAQMPATIPVAISRATDDRGDRHAAGGA